jgi:hypothetical protein
LVETLFAGKWDRVGDYDKVLTHLQFSGAGLMKFMPSFVVNGMVARIAQDMLEWRQRVGDPTAMKPL